MEVRLANAHMLKKSPKEYIKTVCETFKEPLAATVRIDTHSSQAARTSGSTPTSSAPKTKRPFGCDRSENSSDVGGARTPYRLQINVLTQIRKEANATVNKKSDIVSFFCDFT